MALRCPKCATPSAFSAADVGASGRMARCECCGTSWLARQFHDATLARPERLPARRPLIIEGEVLRSGGWPKPATSRPIPGRARLVADRRAATAESGKEVRKGWRAPVGAMVAAALVVVAVVAAPILTALPGLAGLFAGEPLAFADVKSAFLRNGGQDAILVEGRLVNTSGHVVGVPAIRISIRDARSEEIYSWLVNPVADELDAGASVGFRSALASPPGGENVALTLTGRAGVAVGLR